MRKIIIWIALLTAINNFTDIPNDEQDARRPSTPTTDVFGAPVHRYDRVADFGTWTTDGSCENTRAKVLKTQSLISVTYSADGCSVVLGKWIDPWSGKTTTSAKELDIDHLVPLANAWVSGAASWDSEKRIAFANNTDDIDMLNAIPSDENRDKGDSGPDEWKPKRKSSWCRYASAWVTIKAKWGLGMSKAESKAVKSMLSTCE